MQPEGPGGQSQDRLRVATREGDAAPDAAATVLERLEAGIARKLPGHLVVRGGELDHRGARRARLQQLDLNGADPSSRLEDGLALDAALEHGVDDPSRRRVEASAQVAR
jgi:hypothetical protein